jgi:hypothetical protein
MKVRIVGVGRVGLYDVSQCTSVNEEGGDGEGVVSEVAYVSLAELDTLCQFGFREPMHLCGCVSEEGGDGEGVDSVHT